MRFVMVGVGAVGGTVAARLVQSGHDLVAVARGAHGETIRDRGLVLHAPDGTSTIDLAVVPTVREVEFTDDDVIVLGVKSQDTPGVLQELRSVAPATTPIACLQNGVENERHALRIFPNVYGVCVMLPAEHLEPGVVRAFGAPRTGILDVGRWPDGSDATAERIAAAFGSANFESRARVDISRRKYRKLIQNLANAVEALTGRLDRDSELLAAVRAEGETVLAAAGIDVLSEQEDAARRGDHFRIHDVPGGQRGGASTHQSLERGQPPETDFLTGEIVLLGRLHGVAAPANELLQQLLHEAYARREPPGAVSETDLLARLDRMGAWST